MSFAFMPIYTGDYLRDTRHLTPLKHGIYFLLLMHCWDQKGPLPLDEQECAGIANCRSADEIEALRYMLTRFFIKMDDGWYNKRLQKEIERAENLSKSRSIAGKLGYQAKAKQLLSNCQASASPPTPTPTLTTTPRKEKKNIRIASFDALAFLCARQVEKSQAMEFLKVRKSKRLSDTETAFNALEREFRAAGIEFPRGIKLCVERSWGGFRATFLQEAS